MKAVFVFSGQGAQFVGMGKDLYEQNEAAKAVFDLADKILGWSVSDICFNGPAEKLTESIYCQPAIYTMSMACLAAFRSQFPNIIPIGCAGLSLGEYAALAAADALSFEDGLRLLEKRAGFMDTACHETAGTMASILGGDNAVIAEVCDICGIDIANYNSPGQTVISGDKDKIAAAIPLLQEKGIKKIIPLNVAGAFHSRLMRSAGEKLRPVLTETEVKTPKCAVAQNFTGQLASDPAEIRHHLTEQVAGSVRWESCIRTLISEGADTVIEFGPGNVLTGLLKRTDPAPARFNIGSMTDLAAFTVEA